MTLLVAAGPLFAQAPFTQVQDAEAIANRMLQQLDSASWSAPYQRGTTCRLYSSSVQGEPLGAVDSWSWHCDRASAGVVTESYYYAFSAAPVLLRLDIGLSETAQGSSGAIRQLIEAKLTKRFGAPAPPPLAYPVRPAGGPRVPLWQWHTKTADLLLFDAPFYLSPLRPPSGVRVIAIAHPLSDAINDDSKMPDFRYPLGIADEAHKRLARELAPLYDNSSPTLDGLLRLLRAARTAQGNRKAAVLLAADAMTSGLSISLGDENHATEAESARRQLAEFGVHLGPRFKDGLRYDHELLWETWRSYPNTEWGEYAFLSLQQSGWDTSFDGYSCPANPDFFRAVIEHGEAFLASHPNSFNRSQVLFALAAAYETWWSVSLAPGDDENYGHYPRRAENDRTKDAARLKAIAGYEQIERLASGSDYALFAARHLPRLRLRLDTGFRRWFCVGD